MLVFDTLTIIAITGNLAFVTVVQGTPLLRRDAIAPKIITPNADTVWVVGHVESVTWDTSNFPPDSQITNPIGQIILGHEANNSLNLDIDHPLASGFKLRDGHVDLKVPNVPPRDDYLIVLYGDSGNTSPAFTITRIIGGSSSSDSASLPSVISSSDENPPPPRTATLTSSSLPTPQAIAGPPTSSSTVPASTSGTTSLSTSSSSSLDSPMASSAAANSSGTSSGTSDKPNLIALTLCIVYAALFLLV